MKRKDFIKSCSFACVSGGVLTTLLESCAGTIYYAQATFVNNQAIVKKTEFINISATKQPERKYVLLKTEKFTYPIYVCKFSDEKYSALLLACTHQGCEVQPQGDFLVCPCHGSEFSNTGVVQSPPAGQDLKTFQITTDNENIYIQL